MQAAKDQKLKTLLDAWVSRTNTPAFIDSDPVQFPRGYAAREDREISAFLAATIAWGRRDLILRSARRMFALMGRSPYDYVMSGGWKKLPAACVHRTFFGKDLAYYCKGLLACYTLCGSPERLFASSGEIFEGIRLFRQTMAMANAAPAGKTASRTARGKAGRGETETAAVYSKHSANPEANSACKRINLALRWLVRDDGIVDLGLWKSVSPSRLYIPLDIHVGRTARRLGLLERKANDRKAACELTAKLREFCPEDPVKYDFALFGLGMENSPKKR
jgi:uncharacterized protein (TIGR02757 family)